MFLISKLLDNVVWKFLL